MKKRALSALLCLALCFTLAGQAAAAEGGVSFTVNGTPLTTDVPSYVEDGTTYVSYGAIPRIHLTTVSQHKFQQGRLAVERLLGQIRGDRRPTADVLRPELVIRSTCRPRTEGGSGR